VVRVRRLADVPLPGRATPGAAGLDLHAAGPAVVKARGRAVVPTGIALEMPEGVEAQVRPRSGLAAAHGIGVLNGPGTIDSDYRGEVKVVLFNVSDSDFEVRPGDRIAQLVFSRALAVNLVESDRLSDTGRAGGGFGHTG
jgi:dUTP pyrophosphatase